MSNISQLSNIVMPEPVPWWPLATGWYLLLSLLALVVIVLSVRRYNRWQREQYRRDAIALIASLQIVSAHRLYPIIKQVSQVSFPGYFSNTFVDYFSENVAEDKLLEQWFALILTSTASPLFTEAQLRKVYLCGFQNPVKLALSERDFSTLTHLCQRWIKEHQRDKGASADKIVSADKTASAEYKEHQSEYHL